MYVVPNIAPGASAPSPCHMRHKVNHAYLLGPCPPICVATLIARGLQTSAAGSCAIRTFSKLHIPLWQQGGLGYVLGWEVLSRQFDWQVASAAEFSQSLAPALLSVVELKLRSLTSNMPLGWQDGSEPQDWCNLLRPFSNMKKLHVHPALCRDVSRALMSNGAQASLELLPELRTLELKVGDDDSAKAFGNFLEARECANRPVSTVRYTSHSRRPRHDQHGMPISTTEAIPQ
ncbi:hypothetical protein BC834DRAFT_103947 [Gloeopeniophorella convolvens]|nr:hypothetical protein BC834DRAFT_103947 [Gloeopeniophorella convolvens]